jgi:AraC-like DNA-binding protein
LTAFFYLLVILGSLQGLVTMVLLYTKKPKQLSNKLLALIVLFIALPGIHLYGHYIHLFSGSLATDIFHAVIPWVSVMALGPLFYFHVCASLDTSFRIRRKQYAHFLPLIIDLFPKLMEIVFLFGGLSFWTRQELSQNLDIYNKYADIPRWLSLAYYVYLSHKHFKQIQDITIPGYQRIHRFLSAMKIFAVIWFLYLIPYLVPASNAVLRNTVGWLPVYIPMSALIYWTGIAAFYKPADTATVAGKKMEPAAYPPGLLQQTAERLILGMESEHLYLDPDLDLGRLSERIQVPPKLISATVNQQMDKSFNQFVNEYRVAAFKRKVLEPEGRNMTITGLAASCGFSSPATFQRSFKQITQLTPTEFMRSASQSVA